MYIKQINTNRQVCNYYLDNLVKSKKLETKKKLIHENTIRNRRFILLDIFTAS